MELVRWLQRPELRHPVLVAAFEGWNDAGDGASSACEYLVESWDAEKFAVMDPEEFYDFTVARPNVRVLDPSTREIEWPEPELSFATPPGCDHDVVFLQAYEPQLRWRTFVATVLGIAQALNVEMLVTLGALLAEVPHTKAVRVTATAVNPELVQRLHVQRSRYEGPTGIVGVLHDAFARAGVPSASLWAAVPHYVAKTPSPKATLALVERAAEVLGSSIDTVDLQIASAAYERQVSEVVAEDEDVAEYVRRLEDGEGDDIITVDELPSADSLAGEVERFLREQGRD